MKKYYYFAFREHGYKDTYAAAIDLHPLVWAKEDLKIRREVTVLHWQEITKEEYDFFKELNEAQLNYNPS